MVASLMYEQPPLSLLIFQPLLRQIGYLRSFGRRWQDRNAAGEVQRLPSFTFLMILPRLALREHPDIVVATPSRLVEHLKANNISIKTLQFVVVDEADLILAYGYERVCTFSRWLIRQRRYDEDIRGIVEHLPRVCQGFLMSATLNPEVDSLKQLVLHTPAVLKLSEAVQKKQVRSELQHYANS